MIHIILTGLIGLLLGGIIAWLIARRLPNQPNEQLQSLQDHVTDRLDKVTDQIDKRLRENARAMNESKSFLADRVSSTERSVREVSTSLGKLTQTTIALNKSTEEIATFQLLLKSPKVRGSFGEVLLGNLLSEVLPSDRYQLQYTLPSSGDIADAIIKLQDGYIVAIDAKFPLANYQAQQQEGNNQDQRDRAQRALVKDIKKHITDIHRKYISPQDNTLEFAFMYIPVEGIYYQTMVHEQGSDSLWDFCLEHKVVPVSPNSFLAYLQTVLIGLRGMKIQEQAKDILQHLSQVRQDFKRFGEDFFTVGKHLTNAKNRFDSSTRRFDKVTTRFEQIDSLASTQPLPDQTATPDQPQAEPAEARVPAAGAAKS